MTEALYLATAPVFTVDGQRRGELARDVVRLEVAEDVDGLRTLRLELLGIGPVAGQSAEGRLYLDGDVVDFGKTLAVSLGPGGSARTVFEGRVSGLESALHEGTEPTVVVYAEDAFMDLRLTRRMRAWQQMSDADVAEAIASEHGLSADVDADGPTYDVLQQWNQSDLAFLRDRAARIQAELWLEGQTLHFSSRESRSGNDVELVAGNHLLDVRCRADLAHQRTSVTVSGWDASAADAVREEVGVEAVLAETSGGLTGPALLGRVFGTRPSHLVREAPLSASEARAWARAEMLRRSRAFVTVEGVTRGTPELDVGARLTLRRVGAPFEGSGYRATSVRHTYDLASGYRTAFQAERPTLNQEGA